MSRTDKDVPDWYSHNYYKPFHRCRMGAGWYYGDRDCDLPELTWNAVKEQHPRRNFRTYCEWQPHRELPDSKWYYDRSPSWWMNTVYTVPNRVRVRDQGRKALQDYNANGDTDVDIADFRRKHNGGWYW